MRKKVMAAVLTAAMVASVSAMPQMVAAADDEFKIGLITDVGGVNDGSFNQYNFSESIKVSKYQAK